MAEENQSGVEAAGSDQFSTQATIIGVIIGAGIVIFALIVCCMNWFKKRDKDVPTDKSEELPRHESGLCSRLPSSPPYNPYSNQEPVGHQFPNRSVGGLPYGRSVNNDTAAHPDWENQPTIGAPSFDPAPQIDPANTYGVNARNGATSLNGIPNDEALSPPRTSGSTGVKDGKPYIQPQINAMCPDFKDSKPQPATKACLGAQDLREIQPDLDAMGSDLSNVGLEDDSETEYPEVYPKGGDTLNNYRTGLSDSVATRSGGSSMHEPQPSFQSYPAGTGGTQAAQAQLRVNCDIQRSDTTVSRLTPSDKTPGYRGSVSPMSEEDPCSFR
ncbi:hypothetical protein PG994_009634 [Apiospora phragmitis]|uniref:Uncharacterized protein n=1 Tax=Apiospora phragmitis TaxID=2905665 RepID=A0ABR1U6N7_9PEZI